MLDHDDTDTIDADCETSDPPLLDGPARIAGRAFVGESLGLVLPVNAGGDGNEFIDWERCDATGGGCVDIVGADNLFYVLTAADRGHRIRVRYLVANWLGQDASESEATETVVDAPAAPPYTQIPPRPRPTPRPPQPHVDPLKLTIAPFVVARKPSFAVRNGMPIVDTGRRVSCPGRASGLPCNLRIVARPSGASADWQGSPAIAAESTVPIAAGTGAKVSFRLGSRAYRLLRAHHRLSLVIAATITRHHSAPVRSAFTITVKAPSGGKR